MDDTELKPELANTKIVRHDFTEAQLEAIKPVMNQVASLERQLSWFVTYVTKEAKLPESLDNYQVQFDKLTGKPHLVGHVPVPTAAKE